MVATMATAPASSPPAKKSPPNIRTGPVPAPVLVSPISVAHGHTMPGSEGGKKGANWMRDQWVANLKKKRMGGCDRTDATAVPHPGTVPVVKAGIRAETSRSTSEKSTSRSKRAPKNRKPASNEAPASLDKDNLSLMQSAMFFNDLGCFELESPSFMRLTPTMRDNSGLLGVLPSPGPSSTSKTDKKWTKPMKKRSNCFSSELHTDPKRRTPRRQPSHGGSFDESDTSSQHSYSSVGTPSNFSSADAARMWGPELDFPNGYVDTFLDLPTPKMADMPTVSGAYVLSTPTAMSVTRRTDTKSDLQPPRLIRTSSLEQESLSQFFEQTSLGGREATRPNKPTGFRTPRQAAASAVDDYFSRLTPSPANYSFSNGRCFQPTPKGTLRLGRDYNFDLKTTTPRNASRTAALTSSSEFDTLVQEYEFTDFDQELDTFYLDSMDSLGNDIDLISS